MKPSIRVALGFAAAALLLAAALAYHLFAHPSLQPYATLEMNPSPVHAGELRVRFLGAATILLDDGETAIMTDGFFTRPGKAQVLFGKIAPDPARIDFALRKAGVDRLAAVLVAHSHHDHAMDSAVVAKRTGALLIGTQSTANIARGAGLRDADMHVLKDRESFVFGRFKVTAYKSPHSPEPLYPGEITAPLQPPVKVSDYKEGGNFAYLVEHDGRGILIQASANFVPGMYHNVHAEVIFLGVATLAKQGDRFVDDYWREVVETTGARLVIPIHWDDFTLPLDAPLQPMPLVFDDFDRDLALIRSRGQADQVAVRLMRPFEPVDVLATPRPAQQLRPISGRALAQAACASRNTASICSP